jgi:hypothetical protein
MKRAILFMLLLAGSTAAYPEGWIQVTAPAQDVSPTSKPDIGLAVADYVDRGSLKVTLDGTDVTDFLQVSETGIVLASPTPLENGDHELVVQGMDAQKVPVPPFRKTLTVQVKAKREGSGSAALTEVYQHEGHHKNLPGQPTTHASTLGTSVGFQTDHSDQALDISTMYAYPTPYAPAQHKFDLSQASYRIDYAREAWKMKLSLGQVMLDDTPFTVSGYSTRGGLLTLETKVLDISLFSLDTRRPFGLSGNVGPGTDTDDHINGFRIQSKSMGGFQVYGTYLDGAETSASSFNIATEEPPAGARVAAFGTKFSSASGTTGGLLEFSQSRPEGIGDGEKPQAYRLQFNSQIKRLTLGFSHQRVEKDFQSPGVPYMATDRNESQATLQYMHQGTTLGLNLGHQQDNLSGESLCPQMTLWRSGLTFNKALRPTVNLNASYSWNRQASDSGSSAFEQKLASHTAMAGLMWQASIHGIQLGATYTKLDDQSSLNNDSEMTGYQASYSVRPASWMDVSSSAQFNRNRSGMAGPALHQTTYNLDVRTRFWQNRLNVDLGGSQNTSEQSAGGSDAENTAYRLRIGLDPWGGALAWLQNAVSLEFRYARASYFGPAQTTRQVLLSINLGLSGRTTYAR